jgi:hypothetical protein
VDTTPSEVHEREIWRVFHENEGLGVDVWGDGWSGAGGRRLRRWAGDCSPEGNDRPSIRKVASRRVMSSGLDTLN